MVAPKKIKLAEAETSLAETMIILNAKRAELKQFQDQLAKLQSSFEAATKKKEDLEYQVKFVVSYVTCISVKFASPNGRDVFLLSLHNVHCSE